MFNIRLKYVLLFSTIIIIILLSTGGCEIYRNIYRSFKSENLINKLIHSDSVIRTNSAIALGRLKSINAVHPLIKTLDDDVIFVRAAAATSLGEIGKNINGSVAALIKLLDDRNTFVRVCAANALGKIGTPLAISAVEDVIPDLIQLLQNKDKWVLRSAIKTLGYVGRSALDAVFDLENLTDDDDIHVRANATWALKQITKPNVKKYKENLL